LKYSARIVANTAATYTRSLLAVGLALFSSRWILQALGATDFGLFNVVGALIVFLTFLNRIMAGTEARHFAYAIGKGVLNDINKWFNTSLTIHLFLSIILVALGWPIAEYVVRNVLTIPPGRIEVCVVVFRLSLIGAFVNMVSVPFIAMFVAKQRIAEIAFWDVLHSIMVFILAWILTQVSFDRLLIYATGMVGIHVLIHGLKIVRALFLFQECQIHLKSGFDLNRLKEMFSFAAWSLFGGASSTLSNQGSTILLNLYFGPSLNAAYGIARQVSAQTNQLSAAMLTAFLPEITAREGRGEYARVISLSHFSSKAGCILVMFLAIPLIIEMDYVLLLWLGEPPEHTAVFCRLFLAIFLIDRLTSGYIIAINARGKIAAYQASIGGVLLMGFPIAWFFFWMGYPPASLGIVLIVTSSFCCIGRVLWLRKLFDEPVINWFVKVFSPCFLVAAVASLASALPGMFLSESFLRLGFSCCNSLIATAISGWLFALTPGERKFFLDTAASIKKKRRTGKS